MPAKTIKKTTKKKVKTEEVSTPVETLTNNVTETVVNTSTETNSETLDNKYHNEFNDLRTQLEVIINNAKDSLSLLRKLEKSVNKDLKKKKKKSVSGFAKPCKISKELSKFLGISNDELIARTDVTKRITQYIKNNKLYDEKNKRNIKPDSKLDKLFNYDGITDKQITYFNLQRAVKHHFSSATTSA